MATVKKQPAASVPAKPLFTKDNYILMLAGIVVMAIGFFLMAGGKSADPTKFNDNEIYSHHPYHHCTITDYGRFCD